MSGANHPTPDDRMRQHKDLRDAGYAPGNYSIFCIDCGERADGCDKRACRCRPCAEKRVLSGAPSLTSNTNVAMTIANLREAATDGAGGWPTTCKIAADELEQLTGELAAANKHAERLRQALKDSCVALDDWLSTHASDMCDRERVAEAVLRIGQYGTIGYIAGVQRRNRLALGDVAPEVCGKPTPDGACKSESGHAGECDGVPF